MLNALARTGGRAVPNPDVANALPGAMAGHAIRWRLAFAGLCVAEEPPRFIAELHDASGQPCFVELPALLANARNVEGLGRLAAVIADGSLRLHHADRVVWDAFVGSLP